MTLAPYNSLNLLFMVFFRVFCLAISSSKTTLSLDIYKAISITSFETLLKNLLLNEAYPEYPV